MLLAADAAAIVDSYQNNGMNCAAFGRFLHTNL